MKEGLLDGSICMRTFMLSKGWPVRTFAMPAKPPHIRSCMKADQTLYEVVIFDGRVVLIFVYIC